jgi:hypothetical protein
MKPPRLALCNARQPRRPLQPSRTDLRLRSRWSISQAHHPRAGAERIQPALYGTSGHLIYYRTEPCSPRPFNAARLEVTGPEAPVVEHVAAINQDGADYTISDGGCWPIWRAPAPGRRTDRPQLGRSQRRAAARQRSQTMGYRPPFSGHESRRQRHRAGDSEDIWTYDLVRRTPLRLTFEGKNSTPSGRPMDAGSLSCTPRGEERRFTGSPPMPAASPSFWSKPRPSAVPNSWSPDGKTLVFAQPGADKQTHLWSVTVPGGKAFACMRAMLRIEWRSLSRRPLAGVRIHRVRQ